MSYNIESQMNTHVLFNIRKLEDWNKDTTIYPHGYAMLAYNDNDELSMKVSDGVREFSQLQFLNQGKNDTVLAYNFSWRQVEADIELTFTAPEQTPTTVKVAGPLTAKVENENVIVSSNNQTIISFPATPHALEEKVKSYIKNDMFAVNDGVLIIDTVNLQ